MFSESVFIVPAIETRAYDPLETDNIGVSTYHQTLSITKEVFYSSVIVKAYQGKHIKAR